MEIALDSPSAGGAGVLWFDVVAARVSLTRHWLVSWGHLGLGGSLLHTGAESNQQATTRDEICKLTGQYCGKAHRL